jgi:hypothetical protein
MSNGIRPPGSGPVSTPATTNVETEANAPKTETTQQQQQSLQTNTPPPNNSNTIRGDLKMAGQIQGLLLQAALPAQAAPDPNAANSLRMNLLPKELEKANIPKADRDELMKQLSGKSGDDLRKTLDQAEAALKSKDATGDVKSLIVQGRVDSYMQSFHQEYTLPDGSKARATPHFRMTSGASGPPGRTGFPEVRADLQKLIQNHDKGLPKDQQLWNPQMYESIKWLPREKAHPNR